MCDTGTGYYGYGAIQSFRSLSFSVGSSTVCRFGARFHCNDANAEMGVGAVSIGDELSFGNAQNQVFGIWYRRKGLSEIRQLTIGSVSNGAETATVTINGTTYSIPLTQTGSVNLVASEIATTLQNNATFSAQAYAEQVDDAVVIAFKTDGAKDGAYTFATSEGGTASATWNQTTAGVTKTSTHIPTSEWHNQQIAGELDPTKGNNYTIIYNGGYGGASFFVESANNCGLPVRIHTISNQNEADMPYLGNPSMRVGMYAVNLYGAASNASSVHVADMFGGTTAVPDDHTRNPRSATNTKEIGTTPTNILTLRNRYTFNARVNAIDIQPLQMTLSNSGGRTAIFAIRGNETVAGVTDFQPPGRNLVSVVDTAGTTTSGNGRPLATFTVSKGQNITVDLKALDIALPPTLRLVISGYMVGGDAEDLSASVVWYEA